MPIPLLTYNPKQTFNMEENSQERKIGRIGLGLLTLTSFKKCMFENPFNICRGYMKSSNLPKNSSLYNIIHVHCTIL